jgi:hypothetical protein
MCAFYILENNNLIPILYKFIEKNVFTQYPVNNDGILVIKHYYHIPLYIIETRNTLYFYIDSTDIMTDIVNLIKRNVINEEILQNENILSQVNNELNNFKLNYPNSDNDDDCLLIKKRLYHAEENLNQSKKMQLSAIFIESDIPENIYRFFIV